MSPRQEMELVLQRLEEEYRFWMVETLKMGRGIELMEEDQGPRPGARSGSRSRPQSSALIHSRNQHQRLEEKILLIRQKLEELRGRLRVMSNE